MRRSENVTWYQSSKKARRGLCSVCRSFLFWHPVMEGYKHIAVAMGVFDASKGKQLAKHTFVGDKGDYYELDDGVSQSDRY